MADNREWLCPICQYTFHHAFDARILSKYSARAGYCQSCGFLQLENPTWLDEAYNSPIASPDTGLVMRNVFLSRLLTPMLYHVFGTEGRFVDFAGGTGLLVRLMRDAGFDYYWHDTYCTNVHARGFEFKDSNNPHDAVTAFEVLEHVQDPIDFVRTAIHQTKAEVFIFSTELYKGDPPAPKDWWYYSFEVGQHISFYQIKTIQRLAEKTGFSHSSFGSIQIFFRPGYRELFVDYLASKITRGIARYKSRRHLVPKTMADHFMLIDKRE